MCRIGSGLGIYASCNPCIPSIRGLVFSVPFLSRQLLLRGLMSSYCEPHTLRALNQKSALRYRQRGTAPAILREAADDDLHIEESLFQLLRSYALREQHPPHCWTSQAREGSSISIESHSPTDQGNSYSPDSPSSIEYSCVPISLCAPFNA